MKVAIFAFEGVGHLNPQLALATKFLEKGHDVRFYLLSEKMEADIKKLPFDALDVHVTPECMKNASPVEYEDQDESDRKVNDLIICMLGAAWYSLPGELKDLKKFGADLILYDPFVVSAPIAAYVLNIPCVSTVTVPSVNHYTALAGRNGEEEYRLALEEIQESSTMQRFASLLKEKYNFDVLDKFIMLNNYLKTGLNICTGIKDFEPAMPEAVKEKYGDIDEKSVYVGPMLLTKEQGRVSSNPQANPEANRQSIDAPFPSEDLQKYKEQGKTIVYVSFGTVATNPHFWNYNPSPTKMFGAKSSGKVFCQAMWQRIFEAFGKNDKYVVVMATVAEDPDALKGFEIPANFIVRRRCPQLDVLKVADVFITHGGANSMMESISAHVPMLVLPYVVDQFDNAEIVSRQGIGMHHSDPINAGTSHFLAMDVETLVMLRDRFAANCARLHKSLQDAGGAEKASQCIEEYVSNFKGHQIKKGMSTRYTGHYINHILSSFGSGRFMMEESGSSFDNVLPDEQQV